MTTRLFLRKQTTPREAMAAAVESFYQRCRARNLTPGTIRFYAYRFLAFRRFLDEKGHDPDPADVTPQQIREFLSWEQQRSSAVTAKHSYRTLTAFFSFLVKDGQLADSPMDNVESIRQKTPIIPTFSIEQIQALLATCDNQFVGVRDRALILTLLDTGLRVSELCSLATNDVDWGEQTLYVMGKGGKGRKVPFGQTTRQAFLSYLSRRGDIIGTNALFVGVLGEPYKTGGVHEMLKIRGERAKIHDVKCTPHNFRRYFAVNFIRNGADSFTLQKILGHSDLTMTRRYCELAETDVQNKHRQFSPGDSLPRTKLEKRKRLT